MKNRLKEFFALYPNETACILFSDGQIFTIKNGGYAKSYETQSGLKSQVIKREAVMEEPVEDKTFDLTKMSNKELVEYAKKLGLTLKANSKRAELIEAIQKVQEEKVEDYQPVNTDENGN